MTSPEEPWRLWILLSAPRDLLGREIRYGWRTIQNVTAYAEAQLRVFDLEARNETTGERWRRIDGAWSQLKEPAAPAPQARPPAARAAAPPAAPAEPPTIRRWWDDL